MAAAWRVLHHPQLLVPSAAELWLLAIALASLLLQPAASATPSTEVLVERFGLRVPVRTRPTSWSAASASCAGYAVPGDGDEEALNEGVVSVAVLDGVVDDALRKQLLLAIGESDDRVAEGPSSASWVRGALTDLEEDAEEEGTVGLGLRPAVLDALDESDAVVELQTRLRKWLASVNDEGLCLSRVPFLALGGAPVPTVVGNAPVASDGNGYGFHVDGDPREAPPSPWRDAFGNFANRARGKPRMLTALVYLSPEWRAEWGAATRFLDATGPRVLDVSPAPGRVCLFDADVAHAVTAPDAAAERRARYSLALKLVAHPAPAPPSTAATRRVSLGPAAAATAAAATFRPLRRADFPPASESS